MRLVSIAGLIGLGDCKSIQPMAVRSSEVSYDRLHHFIEAGVWDSEAQETALCKQAGRCAHGRGDGPKPFANPDDIVAARNRGFQALVLIQKRVEIYRFSKLTNPVILQLLLHDTKKWGISFFLRGLL